MKFSKTTKLATLLATSALFLAGCVQYDANRNPHGVIYEYMVLPTQAAMDWLAATFNGSYGMAIIIISVIIRLLLMPSTFKQSRTMLIQQEKTAKVKPYVDEINARAKAATSPEERATIQQEQMELYRLNDISLTGSVASGCLPLLIQLPIFNAMYNAIHLSPKIAESSFLGIPLGQPFIPLALAAGVIYFLQSYLSQANMAPEQKQQMRTMLFMSPAMILLFTWSSPAGLGLYFFIGGVFALLQTWIQNSIIRPRVKAEIDAELADKEVILPKKTKSGATTSPQAQETFAAIRNRNNSRNQNQSRNSGKQNRKK